MGHARKKQITIFVTTKCNLRCRYCLTNAKMSADEQQNIDLDFAKMGIEEFFSGTRDPYIRFYGVGEPTQEFGIIQELARFARQRAEGKTLKIEIQTNGVFSAEIAEWIGRNVQIVWLSLDGPPEVNDRYRISLNGHPASEIALRNLHYLKDRTFVGVRSTITDINVHRQVELVEYFNSLGIKHLNSKPVLSSVRKASAADENEALKVDLGDYCREFVKAWRRAEALGVFYGNILMVNFDEKVKYACRSCLPCPHLTTDGYVSACDRGFFGSLPMPDLMYGKYLAAESKIEYYPERIRKLRSRSVENLPLCRDCEILDHCAGSCVGTAYQMTGDMFGVVEEYCEAIRYLAKHLPLNTGLFPQFHP